MGAQRIRLWRAREAAVGKIATGPVYRADADSVAFETDDHLLEAQGRHFRWRFPDKAASRRSLQEGGGGQFQEAKCPSSGSHRCLSGRPRLSHATDSRTLMTTDLSTHRIPSGAAAVAEGRGSAAAAQVPGFGRRG